LTATIKSTGAELISLKSAKGIEYIWQRDPRYWSRSAPILFPIVGNLRDKQTVIKGKTYHMNIHGFLRDMPFEVLCQKENEISLVNTYTNDTLSLYPYKYKVIVTYTLMQNTLRTKINVVNEYEELLPFNLGGHPAFNCPLYPGEDFSDYTIHFAHAETFSSPKVESNGTLNFDVAACSYHNLKKLQLDYGLFAIDTLIIPRVKSKKVKLLNKKDKGIVFSFPQFITFAVWSPPGKQAPFVCLEPWIGHGDRHNADNDFMKKDNLITLKTLEEFSAHYDIETIE
jgi:galactose mutarotase-like enzyme